MRSNKQSILSAKDLKDLNSHLRAFVRRKCWKVTFSYGGELCLHCGRHISYESPLMAGQKKGEWIFGTRGTAWEIVAPRKTISSSDGTESELERKVKILEGRNVTDASVAPLSNVLTIGFGRDHLFRVLPAPSDDLIDLPFWELFTPNDCVLTFGPLGTWSYKRSDVPEEASQSNTA